MTQQYIIPVKRWETLKQQLANEWTPGTALEQLLRSVESSFELHYDSNDSIPVCSSTRPGSVLCMSKVDSVRPTRDVATQLCTVRLAFFSRHVLASIQARLSAKRLARIVGTLALQVNALAYDFARVLALLFAPASIYAADSSAKISNGDHLQGKGNRGGEISGKQARWVAQQAMQACNIISADSVGPLCATNVLFPTLKPSSGGTREDIRRVVSGWVNQSCAAFGDDQGNEDRTLNQAQQQQRDDLKMLSPFLCRRCREDQRGTYKYDEDQRRLAQFSVPRGSAGVEKSYGIPGASSPYTPSSASLNSGRGTSGTTTNSTGGISRSIGATKVIDPPLPPALGKQQRHLHQSAKKLPTQRWGDAAQHHHSHLRRSFNSANATHSLPKFDVGSSKDRSDDGVLFSNVPLSGRQIRGESSNLAVGVPPSRHGYSGTGAPVTARLASIENQLGGPIGTSVDRKKLLVTTATKGHFCPS